MIICDVLKYESKQASNRQEEFYSYCDYIICKLGDI